MKKELKVFAMLARILFFPARWVEWLFWIGQVVTIICLLIFQSKVVLLFWSCSVLIPLFFGFLFIPQQILTLMSGRQLALISELKLRVFVLVIFIPVVLGLWSSVLGYMTGKPLLATILLTYIWASGFLALSIYLRKLGTFVYVAVAFLAQWIEKSYSQLININPIIMLVASLGIWVVFYLWWRQWRPEKFYVSSLSNLVSGQQARPVNVAALWVGYNGLSWFRSKNLVNAVLWNGVDVIKIQLSFYVVMVIVLMVSVLTNHYLTHESFTVSLEHFGHVPLIFLLLFSISPMYQQCMSVHKTWLHFMGNRQEHFQYIDCILWNRLAINAIAAIVYGFCLYYVLQANMWVLVNLIVAIILFPSILFYSHVHDFHKHSGYGRASFYVTTLMIVIFVGLLAFVAVIVSVNGPSAALLIKAAIGNVGLFISMLVMRQRLKRWWLHVDFVRSTKL